MKTGVLFRYKDFLPLVTHTPLFSLGEGDTPLVRCDRLAKEVGCGELYLKLESCNPTGSFKDRGMVVAVAKAVEAGSEAIICDVYARANCGSTSGSYRFTDHRDYPPLSSPEQPDQSKSDCQDDARPEHPSHHGDVGEHLAFDAALGRERG